MARAIYNPYAKRRLLTPESTTEPVITPRVVVLHTHGGPGSSYNVGRYFDREDIHTEAHESIDWDGTTYQFMPFNRQADAQWDGNGYWRHGTFYGAVSIETRDDSDPNHPWTDAQLTSIVRDVDFLCREWSIPRRLTGSWDDTGIGYHSRHWNWNKSNHNCPGFVRTRQLVKEVLPEVQNLAKVKVAGQVNPLENDMGKFIRVKGHVYQVVGFKRLHVPNAGVLRALGVSDSDIEEVDESHILVRDTTLEAGKGVTL